MRKSSKFILTCLACATVFSSGLNANAMVVNQGGGITSSTVGNSAAGLTDNRTGDFLTGYNYNHGTSGNMFNRGFTGPKSNYYYDNAAVHRGTPGNTLSRGFIGSQSNYYDNASVPSVANYPNTPNNLGTAVNTNNNINGRYGTDGNYRNSERSMDRDYIPGSSNYPSPSYRNGDLRNTGESYYYSSVDGTANRSASASMNTSQNSTVTHGSAVNNFDNTNSTINSGTNRTGNTMRTRNTARQTPGSNQISNQSVTHRAATGNTANTTGTSAGTMANNAQTATTHRAVTTNTANTTGTSAGTAANNSQTATTHRATTGNNTANTTGTAAGTTANNAQTATTHRAATTNTANTTGTAARHTANNAQTRTRRAASRTARTTATPVSPRSTVAMRHQYTTQNDTFMNRSSTGGYSGNRTHVNGYDNMDNYNLEDGYRGGYGTHRFSDTFYRNIQRDGHRDGGYRTHRFGAHNIHRGGSGYHMRDGLRDGYYGPRYNYRAYGDGYVHANGRRIESNLTNRNTPEITSSVTRARTTTESAAPRYNTVRSTATRGIYRNTAADSRNATITFVVILVAIAALLALTIYALMRPRHDRITTTVSDNENAHRRR